MLDHSKANVTIAIGGLALACINGQKRNRCEVGILRCDRHKPILDIQRIELHPKSRKPLHSSLVPHSLNLDEDIVIDVEYGDVAEVSHCKRGVSTYTRRDFDRLDDTGDAEDFRWIADLEGPEFYDRRLKIKRRSELKPVIFISDGTLYTSQKTDEVFARVLASDEGPAVPLGKLGYGLSADITYPEGSRVVLKNGSDSGSPANKACSTRLLVDGCSKYVITIENYCESPDESDGTDFRLFYDVLQVPGKRRFDLRRIVETGPCAEPEEALDDREDFSLDGSPQICLAGFLGGTQTLNP
ncbi:MAG TPA: hypothetical protein VN345_11115 [Blastocatellia bacterium]|nr:hypothetical protein [Blastocatellia bacterium]